MLSRPPYARLPTVPTPLPFSRSAGDMGGESTSSSGDSEHERDANRERGDELRDLGD